MLDVHPVHEPIHGWRDFLLHLSTITVGLLIALALEGAVEWNHHRHQVAETREALRRERDANRKRFTSDVGFWRNEAGKLRSDSLLLRSAKEHPGSREQRLPGGLVMATSYARMGTSAWQTAQSTAITTFMPQDEVQGTAELYSYFDRLDRAHEDEADAIAEAVSLFTELPQPSLASSMELEKEQEALRRCFAKHLRQGFLMQNLAEQYPEFAPAPSRDEIETWIGANKTNDGGR